MKKYSKKVKIVTAIITIIMIIGIAITLTIGLNYSLKYQESKKIELYVEKEFETSDIKQIAKEVLQNDDVIIQKVEVYGDSVSIIAKNITDEQKESLITKINEKYGTELSADSTQIQTIPSTRGRDIVKQYIAPFAIATILIIIYVAIRYYKLNIVKVVLKTVLMLVVTQVLLLSIIAIARIPVGRLTMPIAIVVYILTLFGTTTKFEKELKIKKENENKKK